MKSDIVLKIITGLLIPFLILMGFLCLYNYNNFDFFVVIAFLISVMTAYLLYYIKYGKVKIGQLIAFKAFTFAITIIFILFLFYIMFKLINFL